MLEQIAVIAAAAVAAAIHSLSPDHWLPYVLLSKGRGWPTRRALGVTAAGATAHLFATTVLGLIIVFLGAGVTERFGRPAELFSGILVIVIGFYLLWSRRVRPGHHHGHEHGTDHDHGDDHAHDHGHDHGHDHDKHGSAAADFRLGAILGARPCAESIPIFLAASTRGVFASLGAVAVWAIVTVGAMVAVVWLSLLGLQAVKLEVLERHGEQISAWLIIAIGVIVLAITI
ncbi:MAG: hypothetical protein ACYC53_10130 [Bacillota bacterium]